VNAEEANKALVMAADRGSRRYVEAVMPLVHAVGLQIEASTLTSMVTSFTNLGMYDAAEKVFERSIDCDADPTEDSWAALIEAKCRRGDIEDAQETMKRLRKLGVEPTSRMYIAILRAMVSANQNDEAFEYWMTMKEYGVDLNVEAYNTMIQQCIQTYQTERAFLYVDEMRGPGRELTPTAETFAKLFEACAYAPMWVNGYQDIVFEAMAKMEGTELVPTTEVYNSIIFAFGYAGDAQAAEYYFWEMRDKGIPQTLSTYNNMFQALGNAQRVGKGAYMIKPRWVRPPEKEPTEMHRLMLDAGAVKTAELISEMYDYEDPPDRGKRPKGRLLSPEAEENEQEIQEELIEALRLETTGKKSRYQMLQERDKVRKEVYLNETGRKISLSLLAEGVDPGPGKVVHITPDLIEDEDNYEDSMNDYLGTGGDDTSGGGMSKAMQEAMGMNGEESVNEGEDGLFDIDDDDPELAKFMDAIKGRGHTTSFDDLLKSMSSELDGDEDEVEEGDSTRKLHDILGQGQNENDPAKKLDEKISLSPKKQKQFDQLFNDVLNDRLDLDSINPAEVEKFEQESSAAEEGHEDIYDRVKRERELEELEAEASTKKANVHGNPVLSLVDNEEVDWSKLSPDEEKESVKQEIVPVTDNDEGAIPMSEVNRQWNLVLFGRCPEPDYSEKMHIRRKNNLTRAHALYARMLKDSVEPDVDTLSAYMSVASEYGNMTAALDIIDKFAVKHDLAPDASTYLRLIRMHVFMKDINGAMERLKEMKDRNLEPDKHAYGFLIQSLSHRNMLVEAIKLLEEAHDKGIVVSNRHIKKLRAHCEKLGVEHPAIYPDPDAWVKDVKEIRRKYRNVPIGNKVHFARSLSFT